MLKDWHVFEYHASIPWPNQIDAQINWVDGIRTVEHWLDKHVGKRWQRWAWSESPGNYHIGVAFRWDQDRLLFVMAWAR